MSNNEIIENEELEESVDQEESNAPSGFSLFVDRLKTWLNSQNKFLVYGISGVILVWTSYIVYQYFYQIPREKEAISAIYKTQELFDVDSFNNVAKDAPKLADEFSGTKGGELAEFMAGRSLMSKGEYKKAIEYLEKVDFKDKVLKYQVWGLLGDAYVENKDLESGLKQYLKAASSSEVEFGKIWWYQKAARVYEKKNEWKEALDIYEKLKKDFPESEFALQADKYIARAKAKLGEM